jgi:hypothetical protein
MTMVNIGIIALRRPTANRSAALVDCASLTKGDNCIGIPFVVYSRPDQFAQLRKVMEAVAFGEEAYRARFDDLAVA